MVCFQTQNTKLGNILEGLRMEYAGMLYWSFGIFYGHLEYFMVIWNILWSFGIFYGNLVMLWSFGNVVVI
jgi:hypothetical protein